MYIFLIYLLNVDNKSFIFFQNRPFQFFLVSKTFIQDFFLSHIRYDRLQLWVKASFNYAWFFDELPQGSHTKKCFLSGPATKEGGGPLCIKQKHFFPLREIQDIEKMDWTYSWLLSI